MKRPATQMSLEEMREPIPPAPHPPLSIDRKARKRDEVIEAIGMDATRAELIRKATEIAVGICKRSPDRTVTSVQTIAAMREMPELATLLAACPDTRWLGGVFLKSRGWIRGEYVNQGARGRPIPQWRMKT